MEEIEPSDTGSICPALGSASSSSASSSSEPSPHSSRSSSVVDRFGRVEEYLNDDNGPWNPLGRLEKKTSPGLQRPGSKESAVSGPPVIAGEAEQFLSHGQDPLALPLELTHADVQTSIDVLLARPYGRTVPGQNPTFRSDTGVVSSQPERKKKKAPSSSSEPPPVLVSVPPSDIPAVSPPVPTATGDSFEVSYMSSSQSDVPAADLLSGPLSHNPPSSPTLGDSYPWSSVHRRSQSGSTSDASPPTSVQTSDFGASSLRSESIQTPSDAPTRPAAAPFSDSHKVAAPLCGQIPPTVYAASQTTSISDWKPDNGIDPSCLLIQPPAFLPPECTCPYSCQTSTFTECPAYGKH